MLFKLAKYSKIILPWLVAAGIFVYLFQKYPVSQLVKSATYLNIPLFVLFAVVYFFYIWFIDCWSLSRFFSQFKIPTTIREIAPVRFASYLLLLVNYGAGQGLFAYFFKRTKQVPFFKSSSLMLFTMIIDVYLVVSLAFIGSFFLSSSEEWGALVKTIQMTWAALSVGFISLILFFKLPMNWKALQWVKSRDLFHTFHNANVGHYASLLLARLPMHMAVNTFLYFAAYIFGVHIPFWVVLAFQPIIILIGTIPITPGGLGTVQVATIELFESYVTGDIISEGLVTAPEILVSITLLFMFTNYLMKAIMGVLFLRKVL